MRPALPILAVLLNAAVLAQAPVAADPQRQYALATSLYHQGRYRDAMRGFDAAASSAATAADSDALVAHARKGKIRAALRVAEFAIAAGDASRLAADAPGDVEAAALHGDALWASGLFDEAEAVYAAAVARDSGLARGRYGVARALASRNRLDQALSTTLAALADAPGDPDIHALAATIYERMKRFADAAAEFDAYARLLPAAEGTAIETARARAAFLRSFAARVPIQVVGADAPSRPVPFKLVKNKVVVQGAVNGVRVDWVIDTGAERTGISTTTAARAGVRRVTSTLIAGVGIPRLRRVQLARVDLLEIGAVRIRNVPVSIRDVASDAMLRWQGDGLSPLALGLSSVIDYEKRQVEFGAAAASTGRDAGTSTGTGGGVRLPMRLHRLALVRGVLNSTRPAYFIVDTGGELISISAETAGALAMPPTRRIPLRVFGLSGLDDSAFLLPGVDLDFAAIAYRKVGLAVLNLRAPSVLLGFQVGGIVGHKFLGGYRATFDLERSELRLDNDGGPVKSRK